jgi:hypothetical protein
VAEVKITSELLEEIVYNILTHIQDQGQEFGRYCTYVQAVVESH